MAKMFSYNGVPLPDINDGGDWYYYIIFKHETENVYICACTIGGGYHIHDGKAYVSTNINNFSVKACTAGADSWSTAEYVPEGEADAYYLAPAENLIWVERDIFTIYDDPNTEAELFMEATDPKPLPTIEFGWTDGSGDVTVHDVTVEQGMVFASWLSLTAETASGVLSCQWFKDDTVVLTDTDNGSTLTSNFKPSASETGTHTYYCVVTHVSDGETTTVTTEKVKVTVNSGGSGGDGGDSGGGDSGEGGGGESGGEGGESGDDTGGETTAKINADSLLKGWRDGRKVVQMWKKPKTWETMFEGEITTTNQNWNASGYWGYIVRDLETAFFVGGETIRLTVNGESCEFVAIQKYSTSASIGNDALSSSSGCESGYDYSVVSFMTRYENYASFYVRATATGTYNVKIERLVT